MINVNAGTYEPIVIVKDYLTIQETTETTDPVIDATGSAAGVRLQASIRDWIGDGQPTLVGRCEAPFCSLSFRPPIFDLAGIPALR